MLLAPKLEARDAAKYPEIHKTAPLVKSHLAPNVNSAEVEETGFVLSIGSAFKNNMAYSFY